MRDGVNLQAVRRRVESVIEAELGRAEEDLFITGLVDSVKAIGLLLCLEDEFGFSLEDLSLSDMETISCLSAKIETIGVGMTTRKAASGG
jgi:acyl carrier protein